MKQLSVLALSLLMLLSTERTSELVTYQLPIETKIVEVVEVETETEPSEIEIEEVIEETVSTPQYVSLGEFWVTAYCPCTKCSDSWGTQTATGVTATEGITIAVDPKIIPYGTEVYINGNKYIAQDCGGLIKNNDIDIYFDTHAEVNAWDTRYIEVFMLMEGE